MTQEERFTGKIAFVTGATHGIGYDVAVALAKQGAHVIASGRHIGQLEKLNDVINFVGGTSTMVPLDLTDIGKISTLGGSLAERFEQIDIMVGCAGILKDLTPVAMIKTKDWYETMTVNYAANFYLLQTLHPLLLKAKTPQGLFLTANEKYLNEAYWGAYGMSKAALNSLINIYQAENPDFRFKTIDPGPTNTALLRNAFPGVAKKAQTAKDAATKILKHLEG